MFKPVSPKLKVTLVEEEILRFWKSRQILDAGRSGTKPYKFYADPVRLSSKASAADLLCGARRDGLLRYKTMQGYAVDGRQAGQGHGIPLELAVEQQLGLFRKNQIDTFGVAAFNQACQGLVYENLADRDRLAGRLAALGESGSLLLTCESDSIEQIWRLTKKLWERSLIYEDYRVAAYCPRCGVCVSEQDAASTAQTVERPSIFVRLPLVEDPGTSLLVWTAQPWMLPANTAVAVLADVDYVIVEHDFPEGGTEKLIVAQPLLTQVFGVDLPNIRIFESFKGSKLQGLRYHPLFTFMAVDKPAHYVVLENIPSLEIGTGLAALAPAFGAADLAASLAHDLPILMTIADDGTFVPAVRPWRGKFIHTAEPFIIDDLQRRGLIYAAETCHLPAAFCPDCSAPLAPMARSAWYLRFPPFPQKLLDQNQEMRWNGEPASLDLSSQPEEWVLGSERYWGSPLPVWECESCHAQTCVADRAELSRFAGRDLGQLDLHRPALDEIKFTCLHCGGVMQRVLALLDARFEASLLPLAQHLLSEPADEAARDIPQADYLLDGSDHALPWFQRQQALNALFEGRAFVRNVIRLSPQLQNPASPGRPVDPWVLVSDYGADVLRWFAFQAGPEGVARQPLEKISQEFIFCLWDTYSSLVTAANLAGWSPETGEGHSSSDPLDRWLLSELHNLLLEVSASFEGCALHQACTLLEQFVIDFLHDWYLPQSLQRFSKNAPEGEKAAVFSTLYQVLVTLSRALAPLTPFLAEEIYQNLVVFVNDDERTTLSVHLTTWPEADHGVIDLRLNADMRFVIRLAALGKKMRSQAGIKPTQPLPEAAFWIDSQVSARAAAQYSGLLLAALNVKKIDEITEEAAYRIAHAHLTQGVVSASETDCTGILRTTLTSELKKEGLAGEFVERVEELRRKFEITQFEQIDVRLTTTPELAQILHLYRRGMLDKLRASTLEIVGTLDRNTSGEIMDFDGQKAVIEISRTI